MNAEAVVGLLVLVVGLITFALGWRRDRLIRQAELVRNYTNDFYGDERLTGIFMAVDHGRYAIGPSDLGTDDELALIRLLDFLNVLGHNWRRGVVGLHDIAPTTLGYAAVRVHGDPHVTWYLGQVEEWDRDRYHAGSGFGHFRELAAALSAYPEHSTDGGLRSRVRRTLSAAALTLRPLRFATTLRRPRSVSATADEVTGPE
jgi:hypothetical protein